MMGGIDAGWHWRLARQCSCDIDRAKTLADKPPVPPAATAICSRVGKKEGPHCAVRRLQTVEIAGRTAVRTQRPPMLVAGDAIMAYTLPDLPYPENALEPNIDAQTMNIHRTKHHQAYINNVNAALEK